MRGVRASCTRSGVTGETPHVRALALGARQEQDERQGEDAQPAG